MKQKFQRTAQRIAIYEFVKDNKTHPSIREIYDYVSRKLSNISMTTVYNTMDLLKKEGLVMELPVVVHGEGRRFDPNIKPHDHLICMSCGKVVDVEAGVDRSLLFNDVQLKDFQLESISINAYGMCPSCKNAGISKKEV